MKERAKKFVVIVAVMGYTSRESDMLFLQGYGQRAGICLLRKGIMASRNAVVACRMPGCL